MRYPVIPVLYQDTWIIRFPLQPLTFLALEWKELLVVLSEMISNLIVRFVTDEAPSSLRLPKNACRLAMDSGAVDLLLFTTVDRTWCFYTLPSTLGARERFIEVLEMKLDVMVSFMHDVLVAVKTAHRTAQ